MNSDGSSNNRFQSGRQWDGPRRESGGFHYRGMGPGQRANSFSKPIAEYDSFKTTFAFTNPAELAWKDVPNLSKGVRRALTDVFRYDNCTAVQAGLVAHMPMNGEKDFLVQAKTGTGKTLAFLIPTVEACINSLHPQGREAQILIVSPTRELATQIAKEAERLVKFTPMGVQCLVGGDSKRMQSQKLRNGRCDIIIGTPGRLLDFINSDRMFGQRLSNVKSLILDEADRMLEIGFKEDIEEIVRALPATRQTLLFSATYPTNVQKLVSSTLRPEYEVINTISPDDVGTVNSIRQTYVQATLDKQPALLHGVLHRSIAENPNFKAIVFCPTTRMTEMYATLFQAITRSPANSVLRGEHVFELHSRKTQSLRTKVADRFRRASSGVLFTSDVSARGVDYPGINLVIQMGIPGSKDQYVHRIGRTGRAGKEGCALLIVSPFERSFLDALVQLPITKANSENGCINEEGFGMSVPWDGDKSVKLVQDAAGYVDPEYLENCFLGNLGFCTFLRSCNLDFDFFILFRSGGNS
jgi:ATP-dependent RNA helicase MSS116